MGSKRQKRRYKKHTGRSWSNSQPTKGYFSAIPLGLLTGGTLALAALWAGKWQIISPVAVKPVMAVAVLVAALWIIALAMRPTGTKQLT